VTDHIEWPEPARPPHAELRTHLTEVRKQRGLSQTEVAKRMGCTQSALSDLESGRVSEPGIGTFARWASALDLELTVQITERVRREFTVSA
jgi:transcriptional regulator with XRE-family HTH domain